MYVCVYVFVSPVKPESGIILSGQKKKKNSTMNI